MLKYAKIINDKMGLCEVGNGTNVKFYTSIGMTLQDVKKSEVDNMWYLSEKCPHKSDEQKLEEAKEVKIKENDTKRDIVLNGGVTYKDILFDSDTDQKINLLAIVSTMGDEDTITWFGMNNVPLECTKLDLINIGGFITALHSFCWNKNAELKSEIHDAQTIEEVDAIVIDYSMGEEDA